MLKKEKPLYLLLALVGIINFLSMPGELYTGDPYAWRNEARSIINHGSLNIDSGIASSRGEHGQFYTFNENNGKWYSKYGVMNGIINTIPVLVEKMMPKKLRAVLKTPELLILNWFFWGLGLIIAFLLYRITQVFSSNPAANIAYVLLTFYSTFTWNYLRTHNSESTQLLFFLLFFLFLSRVIETRSTVLRPILLCWLSLSLLVFTKISFLILIPIFSGILLWPVFSQRRDQIFWFAMRTILLPAWLIIYALWAVNVVKFGHPLLTGYHQWRPEIHGLNGSLWEGVYGFLFSEQRSIFIHFPILIFAMLGFPHFYRRYKAVSLSILLIFLVFFFTIAKLPSWRGEWCYGPRYLLFILPTLGLPCVTVLNNIFRFQANLKMITQLSLIFIICAISTFAQIQVNHLPFFFRYSVQPNNLITNEIAREYFSTRHFARINFDFIKVKSDIDRLRALDFFKAMESLSSPHVVEAYRNKVREKLANRNYYWFRK
ncbi:MAG: hypothetical protein AABY86_03600 [Bdellovibrionota bacterium]